MNGPRRSAWTILLLREQDTETRRIRLDRVSTWALLLGVVGGLLLLGGVVGALWTGARDDARVRELEAEVNRLRGEQAKVAELARRLEEIQEEYGRVRRALGSDGPAASAAVRLPDLSDRRPGTLAEPVADPGIPSTWPLAAPGFVTRPFGTHLEAGAAGHPGLDIAVPVGSYVRAAGAGRVLAADLDSVYGYHVRIAHRDRVSSLYAHNSWLFVEVGDSVERRQVIALSGNTGQSTAPHLHFEVRRDGRVVDPLEYLSPAGR